MVVMAGIRAAWGLRQLVVALAVAVTALAAPMAPARAALRIEITEGQIQPLPIAIPAFLGADAQHQAVGARISQVVTADLQNSGLFRPPHPASFVEQIGFVDATPQFGDWRAINAQALVVGGLAAEPDGRLRVQFRLWDVVVGEQIAGLQFYTAPENWRRVAHLVADAIYEALTGEKGYFDSRVVYVDESGPKSRRVKRLAIMDQDGENHRYLTDGADLVLTPRFSPTSQLITYLSYSGGKPSVFLLDLETGRQERLGNLAGMTFAPRFSPDGRSVIFSRSEDGNSDIYVMDIQTRRARRLTQNPAIDTSPSYSPDGSQIVFTSDRGGSQQIYVMSAGGGGAHRISFGKGNYSTPVWSPRGDLIAFTRAVGGRFQIAVMRPDGSGEKVLSESFLDEGPTWSPNGRVLMFFRETPGESGSSRLWAVNANGGNARQIPTPRAASDPAWSPLLE